MQLALRMAAWDDMHFKKAIKLLENIYRDNDAEKEHF